MGELSAETLQRRGVRGYIVDGGCRDIDFILKMGFPVFARFFTPSDIVARWMPTATISRRIGISGPPWLRPTVGLYFNPTIAVRLAMATSF